jgi:hypothetical protein
MSSPEPEVPATNIPSLPANGRLPGEIERLSSPDKMNGTMKSSGGKSVSVAILAMVSLGACMHEQPLATWTPIARPAPEDPVPAGISYLCEGNKEVSVVYAKNRATVTFGDKTWRMEYQPAGDGFLYSDTANQWTGRDDLASLRASGGTNRPMAYNCRPTRRTT